MSKELKMGEKVEVKIISKGEWLETVFLKYGAENGIIAVSSDTRFSFLNGYGFHAAYYEAGTWRIPEEKMYRPFTWEERDQLRGEWVKRKNSGVIEGMIDGLSMDFDRFLIYFSVYFVTNNELLDWYTFLDGSPCGVPVKKTV